MPQSRTKSLPDRLRAGRLSTFQLFAFGMGAVTPLTVIVGAIGLGYGQVRQLGTPACYLIVAVVLALFAVGLAAMARHVPNSGAFYSYAAAGLGRPAGVAAAAIALVAYNAMQIGLYGAFGVAASAALDVAGVRTGWSVCALAGWAAITVLGQLKSRSHARILAVLVCAEIAIVVLLDAVMLGHPADGVIRFDTLNPLLVLLSTSGAGALIGAITGSVGFEIPLAFAGLARDPQRTVRRAIYLILATVTLLYAGSGWAMSVVAGPDRIITVAGQHRTDLFFHLAGTHVPPLVIHAGMVLFATSLFAAMLAFHATVARYTLTLAREGVLPRSLARTRADDVPAAASGAQSTLAVAVLLVVVVLRLDPTIDLFFFGTVSGGLGVLVLMSITAVAVIRFFHHRHLGENLWRRRIAPTIAAGFLFAVLAATLAFFGALLGTTNPYKIWAFPVVYGIAAIVGVLWANRLQTRRPDIYAVIGHGDRISTGRPGGEHPPATPPARRAYGIDRQPAESPGRRSSYLNP